MKIIAHHPVEDYGKVSARAQYMRRYRDSGILKIFGVTYLQFMQLPYDEAEEMLRQAAEGLLAENQRAASVENNLAKEFNNSKQ